MYILESRSECSRLESQSRLSNYSLEDELQNIEFSPRDRILDVGCGSGILSRHIVDNYQVETIDACDLSDIRLAQAKDLSVGYPINFFQSSIFSIEASSNTYDKVFCRYVLQHLEDPVAALKELRRILKPGGMLIVIDADGIVFNLHSDDSELNEMLSESMGKVKFDMYVGRKISAYLRSVGFSTQKIFYDMKLMTFFGIDREEESKQYDQRLTQAKPLFDMILGTERADCIIQKYLKAVRDEANPIYYVKFIYKATK